MPYVRSKVSCHLVYLAAMRVLHESLLKVMQSFFANFLSNFRTLDIASKPQTRDVEDNGELLRFNVAALYKLQPSWLATYDISCAMRRRYT